MNFTLGQALKYIIERIDNNKTDVDDITIPTPVVQEVHIDPAPLVELNSAALLKPASYVNALYESEIIKPGTSQSWSLLSMQYYPWARNASQPDINTSIGHIPNVSMPVSKFRIVSNNGATITETVVDDTDPVPQAIPMHIRNNQYSYKYSYSNKQSGGLNSLRNFILHFQSYRGNSWIPQDGDWHPKLLQVSYSDKNGNITKHTITTIYFRSTYSNYYTYGQLKGTDSFGNDFETSGQTGYITLLINVDVPSDCNIICFDIV